MVALCTTAEIGVESFASAPDFDASEEPCADPESAGTLSEQPEALERKIISRVMEAAAGNQSEAARRLGLNRGSLIGRLKKYGLMTHTVLRATLADPVSGSSQRRGVTLSSAANKAA
jgi:two-component system, NtrC family, response regulator AtoC